MMLPLSFARTTLEVFRYPQTVDHGALVIDYSSTPSKHEVEGCVYQPVMDSEDTDGRSTQINEWVLLMPGSADIRHGDEVLLPRENVLARVGHVPPRWPSPTGALAHVEVRVRAVKEVPSG